MTNIDVPRPTRDINWCSIPDMFPTCSQYVPNNITFFTNIPMALGTNILHSQFFQYASSLFGFQCFQYALSLYLLLGFSCFQYASSYKNNKSCAMGHGRLKLSHDMSLASLEIALFPALSLCLVHWLMGHPVREYNCLDEII